MIVHLHEYGTFWFYAGVCLVGVLYVLVGVPETKVSFSPCLFFFPFYFPFLVPSQLHPTLEVSFVPISHLNIS